MGDLETAKGWVIDMLWGAWLKGPSKMYCKGDFKGLIWAEFADAADREAAIQHIKGSRDPLGNQPGMG